MKKLALLLAALSALSALSACNTIAGVGEDISGGARATQSLFD